MMFGFQIVRSDRIRPDLTVSGVVLRPAVSCGPDTVESTRILASRTINTGPNLLNEEGNKGEEELLKKG